MKYWLDASGLFYFNNSFNCTTVSLVKKPDVVSRYVIYETIEPLKLIKVTGKFYTFKEGEYLEVDLRQECDRKRWNNTDRVFFQLENGVFVQREFKPIESLEGELEFARQLNLELNKFRQEEQKNGNGLNPKM